jgi:hypothetical protein
VSEAESGAHTEGAHELSTPRQSRRIRQFQYRRQGGSRRLLLDMSKYPPAEPEALRLLAPQRGLIATGEKQKQLQRHEARQATGFGKNEGNSGRYTPGILKV